MAIARIWVSLSQKPNLWPLYKAAKWEYTKGKYLDDATLWTDPFPTLDEAKLKCLELSPDCGGVTMIPGNPNYYEVRKGPDLKTSGMGADSYSLSFPGMVQTKIQWRSSWSQTNHLKDPPIEMKKGEKYKINIDLKGDIPASCKDRMKKINDWVIQIKHTNDST